MAVLGLNPGGSQVLLQLCFEVGNTACLGFGLAALAPTDRAPAEACLRWRLECILKRQRHAMDLCL
jgi:hypothetical protein